MILGAGGGGSGSPSWHPQWHSAHHFGSNGRYEVGSIDWPQSAGNEDAGNPGEGGSPQSSEVNNTTNSAQNPPSSPLFQITPVTSQVTIKLRNIKLS